MPATIHAPRTTTALDDTTTGPLVIVPCGEYLDDLLRPGEDPDDLAHEHIHDYGCDACWRVIAQHGE